MAQPKVIATVRSAGPIGDIKVNVVTNRVYFVNPDTEAGTIGVLEGRTNRIIARIPVGRLPSQLGINPQTNRIYVPNFRDENVSVINGRTNQVIKTVKVGRFPDNIGVNIRTNLIYVTSAFGTLFIIDGKTNQVRKKIEIGGRPSRIVINELTNRVYVTNTVNDSVTVINGTTQAIIATIKVGSNPVIAPALNKITNRIYVANNLSRFLSVINGRTNKLLRNVQLGRLQSEVVINPLKNRIYVSSAQVEGKGRLFVIDGRNNKIITTKVLPTSSNTIINPNTNHLFVGNFDKNHMSVYNATTFKRLARFSSVSGSTVLNPLTNRIYVGGNDSITVIQDGPRLTQSSIFN
ncbi:MULTISPECIES: YncE family protein [unclassified Paenibacillus]|uniref:YncE family protein n=1 Tax=unclassified Paenibacillus TaxID=185978 RepID=UPI0030D43435